MTERVHDDAKRDNARHRHDVIPDFYTVGEMAELLRVRPGTLRNRLWRNAAGLPTSILVGGRRLFPRPEYEAWKRQVIDAQASRRA